MLSGNRKSCFLLRRNALKKRDTEHRMYFVPGTDSEHPSPQPVLTWLALKKNQQKTWYLGTWFSGGLGSVRFTVGLDDLTGLFQPKWLYDPKF